MSKIKLKETRRDIRTIDKAVVATEHMKDVFIRTKHKTESMVDDSQSSPSEYAEQQIKGNVEDAVASSTHTVKGTARKLFKRKEKYTKESSDTSNSYDTQCDKAENQVHRDEVKRRKKNEDILRNDRTQNDSQNKTVKTRDKKKRTIKQTSKSTGRYTLKTANHTIKSSEKNVKTTARTTEKAIKTTERAAMKAQKAAKATAKTAQKAAQAAKVAARATVQATKAVARATVAAVKAIVAGVKALAAAIAAGGWVAVLVIVIICLVALIVGSCFGIFFSSEDDTGTQTMESVSEEINAEYESQIQAIKDGTPHDMLEMTDARAVWKEVVALYSVRLTNGETAVEVVTMNDEKKALLKEIFGEMNVIESRTEERAETVVTEIDDGNGNITTLTEEVTRTYLCITVKHKTIAEMAEQYNLTDEQKKQLDELLAEENNAMWEAILGDFYSSDYQIVSVALSQLGNVGGEPYWSWYGFSSRVEWCSCFVSWCANECGYLDSGIIPKFSGCANAVPWFKSRGQWRDRFYEPSPGMLIFFDWDNIGDTGPQDGRVDHVGIVQKVEDGKVYTVEGNSSDRVQILQYEVGYYEILGYGVPRY